MAHFRATIQGNRGEASLLVSQESGIFATVNGWNVGVMISMWFDPQDGLDKIRVTLTSGSNGYCANKVVGVFTKEDLQK